jgi:IS30 family transposase
MSESEAKTKTPDPLILLRQFFPKGSDLTHVPPTQFEKVQHLLNNRPRRRLGYRTPLEIFSSRLHCD